MPENVKLDVLQQHLVLEPDWKKKETNKKMDCFFMWYCQNYLCVSLYKNYFNFSVLFCCIFELKWNWFRPNAEVEEYWIAMFRLHVRFHLVLLTSKANEQFVLAVDLPGVWSTCTRKPSLKLQQHSSCNWYLMKFNSVWLCWLWTLP